MTIKQLGGVFGRNPTFNDVTIEGTLTFDGALDINSDINLPDNKKITFGDGDDLQIYHDGSNSFIDDAGTGDLYLRGSNAVRIGGYASETAAVFNHNGSVELKYDNVTKFATTSTGIDVNGIVTTDDIYVGAGSATSPSVQMNDTNSGLFAPAGNTIAFSTAGGERVRIDSSGNVGINTIPKAWTAFNPVLQIKNASTGGGGALAGTSADNFRMFANTYYDGAYKKLAAGFATQYAQESGTHVWSYAATGAADSTFTWSEAMRLDSSGNLLVGATDTDPSNNGADTTADDGVAITDGEIRFAKYQATANSGSVAYVNRTGSDGDLLRLRKSGVTVGSIGTRAGDLSIGTGDTGLNFWDASDKIIPENVSTGAARDDAIDLGASSVRFKDIYATNGTIQTSDRNEKQDIESLSEAEQRVAVAVKGLLRKFRWKSAVEEKGENARIHFGIIAQDLQAAFEAEGLDAGRYGMFINSTWTDEETGEERSRMGVRYSELLAFIIAAI